MSGRAALRRPGATRARYEEPVAMAVAGLILFGVVVLPLAIVLAQVQFGWSEPRLFQRVLGDTGELLLRSLALSSCVTALAVIVGVPLGVLLAKTDVHGARAAVAVHSFPIFLPPFLLALGWFYLFGRNGLLGSELTSRLLFSAAGAIIVMALALAPVVTCLTMLGLSAVDRSLEEAARLVARPWLVLRRVLLPSAWPAEILAVLVVFTLAFSELGVPMFLRVRVYPAAVFSRLGGAAYAPGEAALLVLPLFVVSVILLALERVALSRRSFAVSGLRAREPHDRIRLGTRRPLGSLAVWCVVALSVIPLAGLVLKASHGGVSLVPGWIGRSVENSLLTAALGALIITALGLIVGRAAARARPVGRFLDAIAVLAFVTPAPLLGIGLIKVWNRPGTRFVYATLIIVVLGYVARYSAIGVRTVGAAIAHTSASFEEAAAVSGATFFRRLFRIVLPMSARGVAVAGVLALVFCLRDLEMAVLYYPAGGEPLPVRILTLEANGPEPAVAALAVVQVLVTAGVVAVGGLFLGARRP